MAKMLPDVTDAELALLQSLWEAGPLPVRQLAETHYPPGGSSAVATVQKLLERLEAKGCVSRRRGPGVQTFEAKIGRDDLIGRRLRAVAEQLCDGSLAPLLTHLVQNQKLTKEERRELRSLLQMIK